MVRQHEAQRTRQVRRIADQHFALDQRLVHEPKGVEFEVPLAAVDQLGGLRGGPEGKVVLLDQPHGKAPPGRVARDPGTVDAAADDGEVEVSPCGARSLPRYPP